MSRLGEIIERDEFTIEWSIKDFLSLSLKSVASYDSPVFSFADESWCLRLYPNGQNWFKSKKYIGLYLRREYPGPPITMECTLGIKTVEGKFVPEEHFITEFNNVFQCCGDSIWISRSKLLKKKSHFLPSGTLTLVYKIKRLILAESESSSCAVTTECTYCNKALDAEEDIQSHLPECEDLPIKCRKCSDSIALKNWYDHKCQMTDAEGEGALCQDFKKILLDGQNHDLILKLGDKELKAHQDVLKARCCVFESMLNHDTAEKKSGIIDIPDCDPQAMEQFLLYVYCGKVEALDQTNISGLYFIADKYDMGELKQKCCNLIKKSLSHTNICEVIQLAMTHSDESLLEYATEYFMDNTVDIMRTEEWQNFLKDNAALGNELMLKSFQKVKDSKN